MKLKNDSSHEKKLDKKDKIIRALRHENEELKRNNSELELRLALINGEETKTTEKARDLIAQLEACRSMFVDSLETIEKLKLQVATLTQKNKEIKEEYEREFKGFIKTLNKKLDIKEIDRDIESRR